jgi:hypothetical protein
MIQSQTKGDEMIEVNEYFHGNVKSLGPETLGQRFTVGVILPGFYEFSTGLKELMEVTHGAIEVEYAGHDITTYCKGESFSVPENTAFTARALEVSSYICYYG